MVAADQNWGVPLPNWISNLQIFTQRSCRPVKIFFFCPFLSLPLCESAERCSADFSDVCLSPHPLLGTIQSDFAEATRPLPKAPANFQRCPFREMEKKPYLKPTIQLCSTTIFQFHTSEVKGDFYFVAMLPFTNRR